MRAPMAIWTSSAERTHMMATRMAHVVPRMCCLRVGTWGSRVAESIAATDGEGGGGGGEESDEDKVVRRWLGMIERLQRCMS